ncbi:O-antigen ligase family protein [Hominifimenecus sp. rT4P-3]|uniref:O-antigen ligase family protein n=1 Tax=Hominifimenecus sp. rT4P-3 TaxID=3242979 RepID=UPI003DA5F9B0
MSWTKTSNTAALAKTKLSVENRFDFLLMLYKGLWIVVLFLKAIPYLDWQISPYIRLLLIPGALLIGWDFFRGAKLWSRPMWLLAAFCGVYGITAFLNRGAGFSANLKSTIYMALTFYLFYGHDRKREFCQVKKEARCLGNLFVVGSFLVSLVCFYTFLFSVNRIYVSGENIGYLGMWDERLWGLYNANTGGAINAISLIASAALWKTAGKGKRVLKIWYGLNSVLQFVCLALTYSRTSMYSLILAVGFGILFFGTGKWEKKAKDFRLRRWAIRAGAAILSALVMVGAFPAVREGVSYLPRLISEETAESGYFSTPEMVAEHRGGVLTGRPILWKAGGRAFLEAPVFGVGRENLYEKTVSYLSDPSWSPDLKAGGVHNGYLTVLISSGLVGSLFFLGFWLWNGKNVWGQLVISQEKTESLFLFGMIFLVMMLIMEFFEARVLYQVNLFMSLFWMGAGYVMDYTERNKNG